MQRSRLGRIAVTGAVVLASVAGLLSANVAQADENVTNVYVTPDVSTAPTTPEWRAKTGLQLGARLAYSFGTGAVSSGLDVMDVSNGALPVIVDLGWRMIPELYLGAYGQFAPVFVKTNPQTCPSGFDCTAQDWRFGLELDYHFLPETRMDPYIGFGAGYEIAHSSVTGTVPTRTPSGTSEAFVDTSVTDRGWEFASLTLGFDYRVDENFGFGPFLGATLSQFNVHSGSRTISVAGVSVSDGPVADVNHTTHELFFAGLRGTFNP